jgi:hypothetical protein
VTLSILDHLALDRFIVSVLDDHRAGQLNTLTAKEALARAIVAAARGDEHVFNDCIRDGAPLPRKRTPELV